MAVSYPRISITFCTACKWNLRAAWYLQELLSTFGTALGEVALVPGTGGVFVVRVETLEPSNDKSEGETTVVVVEKVIWDRVVEGGFPGKSNSPYYPCVCQ